MCVTDDVTYAVAVTITFDGTAYVRGDKSMTKEEAMERVRDTIIGKLDVSSSDPEKFMSLDFNTRCPDIDIDDDSTHKI